MFKRSDLNKKAVSAVVATVLIIMITVAAVGIVWAVIIPMIQDNLGNSAVCNDADVSIGTTQGYTCYDSAQKIVAVQAVKGANNVVVSGIRLIASSSGNSVSYTTDSGIDLSSSKVFYLNVSKLSSIDEVSIVPILTDGKKSKECSKVSLNLISRCNLGNVDISAEETCFSNSDCEDVVCQQKTCNTNTNWCEYSYMDAYAIQAGLCDAPKKCDGGGNCLSYLSIGECPKQECKDPTYSAGECGFVNSSERTECDGGMCDGSGNCVECLEVSDCPFQACKEATCSVSNTCEYTLLPSCNLYYENFEGDAGGWSHFSLGGGNDDWHTAQSSSYGDSFDSIAYGVNGNNCNFYDVGDGCYNGGVIEFSKLVSPEIYLRDDYSFLELNFSSFAYDEGGSCLSGGDWNYDGKDIGISVDGGNTWRILNDCWALHDYKAGGFSSKIFDISAYKGQKVSIVFAYNTIDSVYGWGWYVDDIVVRGYN